jgi:hypothetical protein
MCDRFASGSFEAPGTPPRFHADNRCDFAGSEFRPFEQTSLFYNIVIFARIIFEKERTFCIFFGHYLFHPSYAPQADGIYLLS